MLTTPWRKSTSLVPPHKMATYIPSRVMEPSLNSLFYQKCSWRIMCCYSPLNRLCPLVTSHFNKTKTIANFLELTYYTCKVFSGTHKRTYGFSEAFDRIACTEKLLSSYLSITSFGVLLDLHWSESPMKCFARQCLWRILFVSYINDLPSIESQHICGHLPTAKSASVFCNLV